MFVMADKKEVKPSGSWAGPKIYHIVRGNLVEEKSTQFYDGDTYVVDNGSEIYIWMGKNSSVDEDFAGAFLSNQIDMERRGAPRLQQSNKERNQRNCSIFLAPTSRLSLVGLKGCLRKLNPRKNLRLPFTGPLMTSYPRFN